MIVKRDSLDRCGGMPMAKKSRKKSAKKPAARRKAKVARSKVAKTRVAKAAKGKAGVAARTKKKAAKKRARKPKPQTIGERLSGAVKAVVDTFAEAEALRRKMEPRGADATE
jgi:hypothetical protein